MTHTPKGMISKQLGQVFLVLAVLTMAFMSSCTVQTALNLPSQKKMPQAFVAHGDTLTIAPSDSVRTLRAAVFDTATLAQIKPRNLFTDPVLHALIDSALANNLDLKIALERIEQNRGAYRSSLGALLPSVTQNIGAGLDRFGEYTMNGVGNFDSNLSPNVTGDRRIPNPTPDLFLGFRTSWEVDFWGKLHNRRKSAYNKLLASAHGQNWLRTQLVAEVARNYYHLMALENELTVIETNIKLQETTLELVEAQKAGGRATELAVQQTLGQLLRTRSLAFDIKQQITEAEARLSTLMGTYVRPIQSGRSIMEQRLPKVVHMGVPDIALRNRPDVKAAEAELMAATNMADASAAALYPGFVISPYIGLNSFALSTLLNVPASMAVGLLSGFTTPFLNRNALVGEKNASKAEARQRFYEYEKTLITGYAEVYTSINRVQNFRSINALRQREYAAQSRAVNAGNELYAAGYADYLELITAQKSALEAELGIILTRRQILMATVDLYQSLGGGWK